MVAWLNAERWHAICHVDKTATVFKAFEIFAIKANISTKISSFFVHLKQK
jgi:hypothetical protein